MITWMEAKFLLLGLLIGIFYVLRVIRNLTRRGIIKRCYPINPDSVFRSSGFKSRVDPAMAKGEAIQFIKTASPAAPPPAQGGKHEV